VLKLTVPKEPYKVLANMPLSHTHGDEDDHHHSHDEDTSSEHHEGSSSNSSSTAAADESLLQSEAGDHKVDLVTYHFDPTPPMSSYLLAWVIGHLVSVKVDCATIAGSKPVAVWGTNDRWEEGLGVCAQQGGKVGNKTKDTSTPPDIEPTALAAAYEPLVLFHHTPPCPPRHR
jgi:hypothetical protein